MPLTQTQLAIAVADRAEIPRAEAKRVLGALEEIVLEELSNAQKVRVVGLVQLTVRVKPAQKKRQGRNPATGEEITIAAKPASVDLRARPLAKAKAALPSAIEPLVVDRGMPTGAGFVVGADGGDPHIDDGVGLKSSGLAPIHAR